MRQLLLTCLLLFPALTVEAQQPTASEIFQKVAGVYAGCRSYSDEGSVTVKAGFSASKQTHFRTAFVSPGRFRFEVIMGPDFPAWIVWKDDEDVRTMGGVGLPDNKRG